MTCCPPVGFTDGRAGGEMLEQGITHSGTSKAGKTEPHEYCNTKSCAFPGLSNKNTKK
jgi:hypothetical protein